MLLFKISVVTKNSIECGSCGTVLAQEIKCTSDIVYINYNLTFRMFDLVIDATESTYLNA